MSQSQILDIQFNEKKYSEKRSEEEEEKLKIKEALRVLPEAQGLNQWSTCLGQSKMPHPGQDWLASSQPARWLLGGSYVLPSHSRMRITTEHPVRKQSMFIFSSMFKKSINLHVFQMMARTNIKIKKFRKLDVKPCMSAPEAPTMKEMSVEPFEIPLKVHRFQT